MRREKAAPTAADRLFAATNPGKTLTQIACPVPDGVNAALCRSGGDGFRAMRRSTRRPAQARHKRRLPFCRQKNRDAVSPRPGSFWHLQGGCPALSLCKDIPCRGGRLCPPLRAVFRLQSKNAICFYLSTIGCSTFAGIEIHRNAGKFAPE